MEQEDPDIMCGCESHVDESYHTSELFPSNYNIYRKDRNVRHGGGVFIGLKKDLLGMEEDSFQTDCEAIWVTVKQSGSKIIFAGKQPLYVGSVYRPTDDDVKPLEELDKALKNLTTKNTAKHLISR